MEKIKYQNILEDEKAIKLENQSNIYLLNEESKIVISVVFYHKGVPENSNEDERKRIILNIYKLEDLNVRKELIKVENEAIIMVNSNIQEYAILFKLSINSDERNVSLEVVDLPEIGEDLMTEKEINGIYKKY